jgi:ribonuclease HI
MGARCLPKDSLELVIDLDTTDDPLHGHQEGRFFHGFYGCYCYLPLFAFVGSLPLWAQLRTSEGDAARGAVDALKKIVAAVRKRCPKARIIVRADSGFCREEIMAWCETQQPVVYYCLKRNPVVQGLKSGITNEQPGTGRTIQNTKKYQSIHSKSDICQELTTERIAGEATDTSNERSGINSKRTASNKPSNSQPSPLQPRTILRAGVKLGLLDKADY